MRKWFMPVLLLFGVLLACEADSPSAPTADAPRLAAVPASHSAIEQELIEAAQNGADMGALLDRDVGCGTLVGFSHEGKQVAFGGLFPAPGPRGICPLSNFVRTKRDGSVDLHMQGRGTFFLVVFDPSTSFPSAGSAVRWRILENDRGVSVFTVSGLLSGGSRVRAHFVNDPEHGIRPANTLWIEGLGYIAGGPPGQLK